jgi:demethylmenaquinone methyltransferase / 2-methoxy-6-polyprenyl-1,4-benzoquinol methylase
VTPAATLPEGAEKRRAVEAMFDRVAPAYDRMNRVISWGLDRGWRRHAIAALQLPLGATVLDVGCGTGDLCEEVERGGYRVAGFDISAGMLATAHTSAPLVRADAMALPVPHATVDGVISGFMLRNVVDLDATFAESARVLRPGGRFVALEVTEPANPVSRTVHRVWFQRVVPFLGARLSSDPDAYRYLPQSVAYLPAPAELRTRLAAAGFTDVTRRALSAGAVQLLVGTRR